MLYPVHIQVERQKQDESLDELHTAVKRLGDMSLSISTELDSQNAYVVLCAASDLKFRPGSH